MAEEIKKVNNFQYCFSTETKDFYLNEGVFENTRKISTITEFNRRKKENIHEDVDRYNDSESRCRLDMSIHVIDVSSIRVEENAAPLGLLVTQKKSADKTDDNKMIVEFRPIYNEFNQKIILNYFDRELESLSTNAIVCKNICVSDEGENYPIINPYTNANILSVYLGKRTLPFEPFWFDKCNVYGIISESEHYTEGVFDGGFFNFTYLKDFAGRNQPAKISNESDIIGKIISKVYVYYTYPGYDTNKKGWMVCASDFTYSKDLIGNKVTVTFEPLKDQYGNNIIIPDSTDNFSDILFKYRAERDENGKLIFRHLIGDELVMREFQSLYEAE